MTGVLASLTVWSGSPLPLPSCSLATLTDWRTCVALMPSQLSRAITGGATTPVVAGAATLMRIQVSSRALTFSSSSRGG